MSMEDLINSMFTNGTEIQAHRDQFRGTEFLCGCGGTVYPFSPEMGLCTSCKEEQSLSDLDYDAVEDKPTPDLDTALSHEIAIIGAEDNDILEAQADDFPEPDEDFPESDGGFDSFNDDESHIIVTMPATTEEDDDYPDYPEPEIEAPIKGVTLNGGPVFEDDF